MLEWVMGIIARITGIPLPFLSYGGSALIYKHGCHWNLNEHKFRGALILGQGRVRVKLIHPVKILVPWFKYSFNLLLDI